MSTSASVTIVTVDVPLPAGVTPGSYKVWIENASGATVKVAVVGSVAAPVVFDISGVGFGNYVVKAQRSDTNGDAIGTPVSTPVAIGTLVAVPSTITVVLS